jgi:hypothetical protein
MQDEEGGYFDPDLAFWECHDCGCAEHDWLRACDLQDESRPLGPVGRVEYRLRRMGVFMARGGGSDRVLAERLAHALPRWADELAEHRRTLPPHHPDWTGFDEP